ncbi:MAG: GNAT family N-acetyltransferase [Bacteroidia bacterium]|nr:GNAT family N-acetyltransferase [Bacteroidia bacterium]
MLNNQPQLHLNLRNVTLADMQALCAIRNTPNVLQYLDAQQLITSHDEHKYINYLMDATQCYASTILYTNEVIGVCYLNNFNPTHRFAFITFYLAHTHWGKGIMKHTLLQFVQLAFANLPQLHRIEAQVHEHNTGSCAALVNSGFVKEGEARNNFFVKEQSFNSHVYAILRTDIN